MGREQPPRPWQGWLWAARRICKARGDKTASDSRQGAASRGQGINRQQRDLVSEQLSHLSAAQPGRREGGNAAGEPVKSALGSECTRVMECQDKALISLFWSSV